MYNLFTEIKTGNVFKTNYIDYFNNVICKGDYRNNKNKLLKFKETREATKEEVKNFNKLINNNKNV